MDLNEDQVRIGVGQGGSDQRQRQPVRAGSLPPLAFPILDPAFQALRWI